MGNGRVQPGQVLNPNGRPKGSKNKNIVMEALAARGFDLIGALVEDAMNNPNEELRQRSRFKLLDRIAPVLKAIEHSGDIGTVFMLRVEHPKNEQ